MASGQENKLHMFEENNINMGNWLNGILKPGGLHRGRSSCPWGTVRRGGRREGKRVIRSLREAPAAAARFPSWRGRRLAVEGVPGLNRGARRVGVRTSEPRT